MAPRKTTSKKTTRPKTARKKATTAKQAARTKPTAKKVRAGKAARKKATLKKTAARKTARERGASATTRGRSSWKKPGSARATNVDATPAGDVAGGVGSRSEAESGLAGRGPSWWSRSLDATAPGTSVAPEHRREPEDPDPTPTPSSTPIPVGIFAPPAQPTAPDTVLQDPDAIETEAPQDEAQAATDTPAGDLHPPDPPSARRPPTAADDRIVDEVELPPKLVPEVVLPPDDAVPELLEQAAPEPEQAAAPELSEPVAPEPEEAAAPEPEEAAAPEPEEAAAPELSEPVAPEPEEAAAPETHPVDIASLDTALAADVEDLLHGDCEAVDELLDSMIDEPVPQTIEPLGISDEVPAIGQDGADAVVQPGEFLEMIDDGGDDGEEPAAVEQPTPTPAVVEDPVPVTEPSTTDDAPEPTEPVSQPAAGSPPLIITVLRRVNYPLRLLPPSTRVIVDWVAWSLIFWVPVVWVIAILVIGR